jgi:hypothetical protein
VVIYTASIQTYKKMTRLLITFLMLLSSTAIGQDKEKYFCTIFTVSSGVRLPPQGCSVEIKRTEEEIKTDCFGGISQIFKENSLRLPEAISISKVNIRRDVIDIAQSTEFNKTKTYQVMQLDILLLTLRGSSDGPFGSSTISGRCIR